MAEKTYNSSNESLPIIISEDFYIMELEINQLSILYKNVL